MAGKSRHNRDSDRTIIILSDSDESTEEEDNQPLRPRKRGLGSTVLVEISKKKRPLPAEKSPDLDAFEIPKAKRRALPPTLPSPAKARECPVCMDSITGEKKCFATTCGHIFCHECIIGAIESQKKCPSCRSKLTKKSIHPLYL
mmetsp:Transcript_10147/g.16631  ORF Transcript_10147/g.16631 Transcript_10147/m.16631 type:complete len:144 (-) Transcript_10147:476-907(-)